MARLTVFMRVSGFMTTSLPLKALSLRSLLIALSLLVFPSIESFAETSHLSAAEIRERFVGNTLVFHHKDQSLARRYLAEDGTADFDLVRGFPVPSHWVLDDDSDRICFWDTDPESKYCGHVIADQGRYFIDWGNGINRDFYDVLEQGNTTDPSDNPGPDYKPDPRIHLPADLNIQPPSPDTPDKTAALAGAWFGTNSVWRDYLIIVEKIDGSHADVVYAWGPHHLQSDNPGWFRHKAEIENGTLEMQLGPGTISGRLEKDGTMIVIFDWGRGLEWSRAIRWDDPSLEPQPPLEITAPKAGAARDKLTFWKIQMGRDLSTDPVHNAYFMPLGEAAPAHHSFEGTLTFSDSQVLGRPAGSRGANVFGPFPAFSMDFISHGDRLVPSQRGVLQTSRGDTEWNIILEPGRIWSEPGDNGWSRASFPFVLTAPLHGGARNGLATFLFNNDEISPLRFQVVKEASAGDHLDLWGQAELHYQPKQIDNRAELIRAFERELANRVEIHPWSDLQARFGAETVAPFDGTAIRPEISHSAIIVDGEVYATTCRTRTGPYPYCREMRHGVHSVTKSLVGLVGLLWLAEKYGDEVLDLKVADYVDIAADHNGWKDVTFEHAVSMVTGIGDVAPTRVSYYVESDATPKEREFWSASSAQDKLAVVSSFGNYPWEPGEEFRYITSNFFVLAAAMDSFLKSKEGPDANLWQMMNEEVFQPIGIPWLPTQHTVEEPGRTGLPIAGSGIYVTLDDVAKIERLIRNQGRHDGKQILSARALRETLAHGYERGYPTGWSNDQGEVVYFRSFWITPQKSRAGCIAPIPGMSGSGGNYVLLMPNGVTAIRFAGGNDGDPDSGTFDSSHMRKVADDIRPLCTP